jgi:hypothetical protein
MTTTDTEQATGPVLETVTRVILHCSRCNAPFKDDDDYDSIVFWEKQELNEAFSTDFSEWDDVQGWIRLGDRYLCFGCWHYDEEDDENEKRIEKPPLSAVDADKVIRDQIPYRAEVAELRDKRSDLLNIRGILSPQGRSLGLGPVVPMPLGEEVAPAVEWLVNEVDQLREENLHLRGVKSAPDVWSGARPLTDDERAFQDGT